MMMADYEQQYALVVLYGLLVGLSLEVLEEILLLLQTSWESTASASGFDQEPNEAAGFVSSIRSLPPAEVEAIKNLIVQRLALSGNLTGEPHVPATASYAPLNDVPHEHEAAVTASGVAVTASGSWYFSKPDGHGPMPSLGKADDFAHILCECSNWFIKRVLDLLKEQSEELRLLAFTEEVIYARKIMDLPPEEVEKVKEMIREILSSRGDVFDDPSRWDELDEHEWSKAQAEAFTIDP